MESAQGGRDGMKDLSSSFFFKLVSSFPRPRGKKEEGRRKGGDEPGLLTGNRVGNSSCIPPEQGD